MELKEMKNFSLLQEYIVTKKRNLNYFEDTIISEIYPYYQEKQLFFLVKAGETDLSYLCQKYAKVFSCYSIAKTFVSIANENGRFYVKCHQIQGWKSVKYPFLSESIYQPIYYDVWYPYPVGLTEGYDYIPLFQDEFVAVVLFPIRIMECPFINPLYNRNLFQYSFSVSQEKSCDIIRNNGMDLSYQYLSYDETFNSLGVNGYYEMYPYYLEQKTELKRILQNNKM